MQPFALKARPFLQPDPALHLLPSHTTLASSAKALRSLDLSWNSLAPSDEAFASEIALALALFVRSAPSLIHLNLTRTGLLPLQAYTLFRAVRKSKSLLAVHLTGNSLDVFVRKQIRSILDSSRFRVYQDNVAALVKHRP